MNLLRKRTCNRVLDNLIWTIIYFLPVVFVLCLSISNAKNLLEYNYFDFLTSNIALQPFSVFYNAFYSIFGGQSFVGAFLCLYFDWLICAHFCHLTIDFIFFLTRWLMSKIHSIFKVEEDKEINLFTNVLWLFLYLLPLIIGFITVISLGENVLVFDFVKVFTFNGFNGIPIFLDIFTTMFGFDGILPFYYNNIFYVFAWFCSVEFFKFVSDFILILFKWMHKNIKEF